ncbi:MAG: AI-2E family transporter [Eubacteriaceae bacterium]|nr:AI-2E family transporter [Eubacteriaceae bacterium]
MKLKFENTYIKWGVTVFCTAALLIIFFFMIYRNQGLANAMNTLTGILTPFIYGLVMAYLLCPLYNWGVRTFKKVRWPRIRGVDRSLTFSKGVSTTISILVLLGVVIGIIMLIVPQMIESIVGIAKTLPESIAQFTKWLSSLSHGAQLTGPIERWVSDAAANFGKWVETNLIPEYDSVVSGVKDIGMGIVNVVKNFFIGVVICVFFINSKEIFAAQSKKLVLAVFREERADAFLRGSAFVNKTFGGFINGKLLDSLIIGVICFIFMSIFHWPYAVLISVIIGVTNIIPFFGPFIGAIPSALLILMESPITCVYFLIFILILQQVDGNIIGPKILGDSTGLSSFWVMFAILIGGGLFGFVGMIIGIPIFAVIYAYLCHAVNKKLDKKGLSTDLRDYKDIYKYKGTEGVGKTQ